MGDSLHKEHRKRMKNRFEQEGLISFSEHQVLELLLFYAIPQGDTNELAHQLLKRYGSLAGVLDAGKMDLCQTAGVGEHTAILLKLIPALAEKYNGSKWTEKILLNSTSLAGEYVCSLMLSKQYEVFYVISLDNGNQLRYAEKVHEGTIDQAAVYPRLVIESVLRHGGAKVILAHNHPGGSMRPSQADLQITQKIQQALAAIDVQLVDHVIAAGDHYYSFAENAIL